MDEVIDPQHLWRILNDVAAERDRQDQKWGTQSHPITTPAGRFSAESFVEYAKKCCDEDAKAGKLTWQTIINEEFYEALAEADPQKRREELVQLAACVVAAIESEDRAAVARHGNAPKEDGFEHARPFGQVD